MAGDHLRGTRPRNRVRTTVLAAAVFVATASTAACEAIPISITETSPPPQQPAQPPPKGPAAAPGTPDAALQQLATVRVAPEDTGAHYDRDDWEHWIDQPRFGRDCDTREMVLIQQGRNSKGGPVKRDPNTCRPLTGNGNTWVSSYDGVTVTDPGDLDIDHIVALEEVARSGARNWTPAQRRAYANDPTVLIAVTSSTNRSKSSDDVAQWLPERERCPYAQRWTGVKARFHLTVDQAEHDAIVSVLRSCGAKAGAK